MTGASIGLPERGGIGVMVPCGPVPTARWHQSRDAFAAFEAAGCSSIWVTDHLFWGVDVPEALTLAAVAATATSRCAIGTGVLQLPLRSMPAVAKAVSTLQAVSGGRFLFGVGSGEHEREYELVGASFAQRGEALDGAIAGIRRLWEPGPGRYEQRPAPGGVPLWIGGRSAAALDRVAVVGDGWLPIFVTPERLAEGNRELDARLGARDRRPEEVRRGVVALVALTEGEEQRSQAISWAARLWGTERSRLARYLFTGSAEQVAGQLGTFVEAGADHIVVLPATDEPVPMVERLVASFAGLAGRNALAAG